MAPGTGDAPPPRKAKKRKPAQNSGAERQKAKPKPPVGKRFEKGKSGNPGGLSAERRAFLAELRQAEAPHVLLVFQKLREMALTGTEWALKDYLDRLGVRMPEKLEISGEDGAPLPPPPPGTPDVTPMTSEQKLGRLAALIARATVQSPTVAGTDEPAGGTPPR